MISAPHDGWIFDADGVLFTLHRTTIDEPIISNFLFDRLRLGEPVAINTGRKLEFAIENILNVLTERFIPPDSLARFMIMAEKGAIEGYFKDGELVTVADDTVAVPEYLREQIMELVRTEFSGTMFEGEIKKSMLSPEKLEHVPVEAYKKDQHKLAAICRRLLVTYELEKDFQVDATRIAVDVQHNKLGKHYGAARILAEWRKGGVLPEQITTFGDSGSDIEMAEEVHSQGIPVTFVYVGNGVPETGDDPFNGGIYKGRNIAFPIVRPGHFSDGTAAYLKGISDKPA